MNINLGEPYNVIIKKIIEDGYAGNYTEVIRQSLLAYEKMLKEEEVNLVNKGIETEMQEIKSKQIKTKTLEQLKKKYKL